MPRAGTGCTTTTGCNVLLCAADLPALPDVPIAGCGASCTDPRHWFEYPGNPLEIEVGSGKGTFLIQEAVRREDINFLGIEWAKEYAQYTADRVRRRDIRNVRMLHGDATTFIHWRMPDSCCNVIHLYFSDPWPKKRHHKRRIIQRQFLQDAYRILTPGGELRIVTDHDDYWAWMQQHFEEVCNPSTKLAIFRKLPFEERHKPSSANDDEWVGTNFERKYVKEGRSFHAAVLQKA